MPLHPGCPRDNRPRRRQDELRAIRSTPSANDAAVSSPRLDLLLLLLLRFLLPLLDACSCVTGQAQTKPPLHGQALEKKQLDDADADADDAKGDMTRP